MPSQSLPPPSNTAPIIPGEGRGGGPAALIVAAVLLALLVGSLRPASAWERFVDRRRRRGSLVLRTPIVVHIPRQGDVLCELHSLHLTGGELQGPRLVPGTGISLALGSLPEFPPGAEPRIRARVAWQKELRGVQCAGVRFPPGQGEIEDRLGLYLERRVRGD